jgi:hypothetical protein
VNGEIHHSHAPNNTPRPPPIFAIAVTYTEDKCIDATSPIVNILEKIAYVGGT